MKKLDVQVLLSTMNQNDYKILEKMNIRSDALIVNQNSALTANSFDYRGKYIEWYAFPEKGVGKSRNIALLRSSGDIALFADDDVVYHDDYCKLIQKEFANNPKADMIVFNVGSTNPDRPEYMIKERKRVHFFNCLRYGTFRIAIRTDRIKKKRIFFSLLFGGGSKYGSGEDSLFIVDCLRAGLRMYSSPVEIGKVTHSQSTWFSGYNEKFFFDKGALFCAISEPFAVLLCLQFCLRHREMTVDLSLPTAFRQMLRGIKDYKQTR